MSGRAYYAELIEHFLARRPAEVLGELANNASFDVEMSQRDAWVEEVRILRSALEPYRGRGKVYFEFSVPRLGKRIDVVALIDHVLFVIEFKVGDIHFSRSATDQVWDYALDLKNFHETSHQQFIAPVLVATHATDIEFTIATTPHNDGLFFPIYSTAKGIAQVIECVLEFCEGSPIEPTKWERGRYHPTPTIIEAAMALYGGHAVSDISRSDANAINLTRTSDAISEIIRSSRARSTKAICFVTGVPGAGKTLIGLNIATKHIDRESDLYSVFLSGNGPLVAILREALARDKVRREADSGRRITKTAAMSEVKLFIQNVHHFRDECLVDSSRAPIEHVALFDEAQRAW